MSNSISALSQSTFAITNKDINQSIVSATTNQQTGKESTHKMEISRKFIEDTQEQEADDLEEFVGLKNAIPTGVKPKQQPLSMCFGCLNEH